jgi:microcompartment protein CcmL/EutN
LESNIGAVEFKSIAKGMLVTDEMLKSAPVSLMLATTLCPGKYLAIVEGGTSSVEKAVETADRLGGRHVFSSFVINGVNSEIIDSISGRSRGVLRGAIGIIESQHMANIISAADVSLDSAEVEIVDAAVQEAVKNAADFLSSLGSLLAFRVIANPDRDLLKWLEPAMCMC